MGGGAQGCLSGFFWILTLWAYLAYARRPGLGRYLAVLLAFSLGLMSKPMVVTLPFVLLLLDYWPLNRVAAGSAARANDAATAPRWSWSAG